MTKETDLRALLELRATRSLQQMEQLGSSLRLLQEQVSSTPKPEPEHVNTWAHVLGWITGLVDAEVEDAEHVLERIHDR